jgi:hypothetical protein
MATLYVPDTVTNPTTVTTAANFIKELWSDEVIAVYKANTVMVPLIQSMPFSGQKGDTVHIPKPARGSVNQKSAGTGVTINVETAGVFNLSIDQHFEYSRLIEDIAKIRFRRWIACAHSTRMTLVRHTLCLLIALSTPKQLSLRLAARLLVLVIVRLSSVATALPRGSRLVPVTVPL